MTRDERNLRSIGRLVRCRRRWFESSRSYRARLIEVMARWEGEAGTVAGWLISRVGKRRPDFIIGGEADPYLLRWWLLPRNRLFNVYLHCFKRSDDDRALHDHPWPNMSILLRGSYIEHTIAAGGINRKTEYRAGAIKARGAKFAHRIELNAGDCWTLFITGPRIREWGFHCPTSGWIPWQVFTKPEAKGEIGPGCGA